MSGYQKQELISVDEAVNKGRRMLLLPRILMIAGLFFFLFFLAMLFIALTQGPAFNGKTWLVVGAALMVSFIVFFYLPFLFWSKRTTRWKLWAFDNVNDVHELKIVALQAHLFPAFGTFMDKLQIQSVAERGQWIKLQERNDFTGDFIDDPSVPAETSIHYSIPQLLLNILLGLFFAGIGVVIIYFAFSDHSSLPHKILGVVIALSPWYMIIVNIKKILDTKPQLILGNKGLYTLANGLVPWDVIYDEEVKAITNGRRGTKIILCFKYPGGIVNLDVTQFAISRSKLQKLMRVYKGRYTTYAY